MKKKNKLVLTGKQGMEFVEENKVMLEIATTQAFLLDLKSQFDYHIETFKEFVKNNSSALTEAFSRIEKLELCTAAILDKRDEFHQEVFERIEKLEKNEKETK